MKENMGKEEKWIYEEIVGHIPPFSRLSPVRSILLQLFLLLFLGTLLGLTFQLGTQTILQGFLAITVAVLWSLLILQLAPTLRKFRVPLSQGENELLERYKYVLFHPHHYEALPGIAIFLPLLAYLYQGSPGLLQQWLGVDPHPILLLFLALLLWDICYRMGLGIWTTGLALWRSWHLKNLAGKRTRLEHTPYTELNYLRKLDTNNIYFALLSLLLLPILKEDPLLSSAVVLFAAAIALLSFTSAYMISQVPWLPPDIYNLVKESNFAYIGASHHDKPHITPVVYVFDGHRIYFNTSKEAYKLKILKKNPKVAFLIDKRDLANIYENKAVLFTGTVKIYGIKDIPTSFHRMLQARSLFLQKYPEYTRKYTTQKSELPKAWQLTPIVSRILIEIKPKSIIYWRGAKQIRVPV